MRWTHKWVHHLGRENVTLLNNMNVSKAAFWLAVDDQAGRATFKLQHWNQGPLVLGNRRPVNVAVEICR